MNRQSSPSIVPGRGARRGLLALALVLMTMLALAFSVRTAAAAPPEVKASENPVVIPYGQSTKQITLTWSLAPGTRSPANLVVTPTPLPNPGVSCSPSCTGSKTLTVTYGTTYTAQLKDAITNLELGAPLEITTKRPDTKPKFDFGCAVQCITSVDVEPHGGWAQFTIKTSETALITLEASTKQPNANGEWSNPADVAYSDVTILPTQSWIPQLPDLQPGTTYHYAVRAHDGDGGEQVKTGSFTTLTRSVEVTFAEIHMVDDSDGAGAGDCDCFFDFQAGKEAPKQHGTKSNQKSVDSDTSVHPNVQFDITDAPAEIILRAFGRDDDTDFGESCPAGLFLPPDLWEEGASWETSGTFQECLQWAGNQIKVSVSRQGTDVHPSGVDEEFTESFEFQVYGPLTFKVRGSYKVTYVL